MAKKTRTYQWRDPSRLATAATWALAAGVIVLLARAGNAVLFPGAADYGAAEHLTGPQGFALALDLIAFLVILACITVLMWIWRVNANAHVFKPSMRFSPLGSIGFYLVPVVSLFLPFAAMEEIWLVSRGNGFKTPPLLRWWWGLLLTDGALSYVSLISIRVGQPEPPLFTLLNAATGIACSLLLMRIIQTVTLMQRDRYASGGAGQAPPMSAVERIASL